MFEKFKISIEAVRTYISPFHKLLTEAKCTQSKEIAGIQQSVLKLFESQDGIISGDCLKSEFFPTDMKKKYNVFISHSHQNIDEIEEFALRLEKDFHVKCFVDSMVWKNIVDLQKEIDNKYSKSYSGGYDYQAVQNSTAHIHALLSIALFEMIEQCECCIFVGSQESLNIDFNNSRITTLSPWIYEEIFYMNHAQERMPDYLVGKYKKVINETRTFDSRTQLLMSHAVDLSTFKPLLIRNFGFDEIFQHSGNDHLTKLYVRSNVIEALL